MTITLEALVMIICAFVGATLWIVTAIYSVRNAIGTLATALQKDIDDHEKRITSLEGEVWQDK